jgi:hypothetical protein
MVRHQARPEQRRRTGRGVRAGTILTLALLAGLAPATAADDPILSRMVGEWIGDGTARITARSEPERIYCRIIATLAGATLRQTGRCSVASNSGALSSTILAKGGGRYEGTMTAPQLGSAQSRGTGSGNRLQMTADYTDQKTKEKRRATVTMTLSGNGYRVVTANAGAGGDYVQSDIVFRKK